ncbi:hypothetical protein NEOKW01_0862 [Nematocida sp. AWRm80]|nr:hypothetical protein NEOKW01_0862 [Nematocida sp. AWRm80]
MNIDNQQKSEQGAALEEKEIVLDRVAVVDALNIMNSWRVVPDNISLKKRMVYALTVGIDCLSLWVYKQIIPFIEKYGIEEFETQIFPMLLKEREEVKFPMLEIRREIEKTVIEMAKKIYKEHIRVYLAANPKPEDIQALRKTEIQPDPNYVRGLFLLLKIVLKNIEDADIKTIEILVFFSLVLDFRIINYLIAYFQKEKDFVLELLLIKMTFAQKNIPEYNHLKETEINEVFGQIKKIEYTQEEAEKVAKEILIELFKDKEIPSVNFSILRCIMYLRCKKDPEITDLIVKQSKDKNKAVRMQCAAGLQMIASIEDVSEPLLSLLQDPDEDVVHQTKVSIAKSISKAAFNPSQLIDKYLEWYKEIKAETTEELAGILIKSKEINHPAEKQLYNEYCTETIKGSITTRRLLVPQLSKVFQEYITQELLLEENLRQIQIGPGIKEGVTFQTQKEENIKAYEESNAIYNLETIIDASLLQQELWTPIIQLLPELKTILRTEFLETTLTALYNQDPQRNWRHWTLLLETTLNLKPSLSAAFRETILQSIQKLKTHWAHVVRKTATTIEASFQSTSIFCTK